jgi:hypothetical protein
MRMLSSADAKSELAPYAHMTGTSTLRDAAGNVVATSDEPGAAQDWAAPAPGGYTLTVGAERAAPWSDLATRQHDVWNLTVGTGPKVTLPALRYRTALDADGRGRAAPTRRSASCRTAPAGRRRSASPATTASPGVTSRAQGRFRLDRRRPQPVIRLRVAAHRRRRRGRPDADPRLWRPLNPDEF